MSFLNQEEHPEQILDEIVNNSKSTEGIPAVKTKRRPEQ